MIASIVPPPLRPGETIAIVAPAGRLVDRERFDAGVAHLQAMGYCLRYPHHLWPGANHLADSDENRGRECNHLFADPEVKALIALRGGFGCLRMLEHLDLGVIATHPKLVVGFSDISILQNYLLMRTGLLSLHGPVVTSLDSADESARLRLARCLGGFWQEPIALPEVRIVRPGKAQAAPLIGGNLASLVSLLGTPYDFSWDEKILFLEDVNEPFYRVDRMLTQLYLAGKFRQLSGLLLGDFSGFHGPNDIRQNSYLESICTRVLELCDHNPFPIWAHIPAGHRANNQTLPFGALTIMDEEASILRFLPAAADHGGRRFDLHGET